MKRSHCILLLWLLSCILAGANYFLHRSDNPMGYDEGDYYEAVQRGFWLNWTDSDNMSLSDFVGTGIRAIQGKASRAELSRFAREQNSTMVLRHQHPPLAYYVAIALQPFTGKLSLQDQLRLANLAWMILWCSIFCLLFVLYPPAYTPWFILLPASTSFAMATTGFNMHIAFGLMTVTFLYYWFEYELSPDKRFLKPLALFFLAAALIAVPYGLFLSFFLCVWVIVRLFQSENKKEFLKRRFSELGWLVLFLLLLWPASILSLGLVRSYIFQMYIGLFRVAGQTSQFASFWDMILWKWNASVPELLIGAIILGLLISKWRYLLNYGSLFVSFLFVCAVIYLQITPSLVLRWYLFPVFSILYAFYIPVIFRLHILPQRGQYSLIAAPGIAIVLFVISLFAVQTHQSDEIFRIHDIIRSAPAAPIRLPLSIYPQTKPYFPSKTLVRLHDTEYDIHSLDDSLSVWRRQGLVVVPRQFEARVHQQATDSTKHYLFFEAIP